MKRDIIQIDTIIEQIPNQLNNIISMISASILNFYKTYDNNVAYDKNILNYLCNYDKIEVSHIFEETYGVFSFTNNSKYSICCDSLDGIENIKINGPSASIFSILESNTNTIENVVVSIFFVHGFFKDVYLAYNNNVYIYRLNTKDNVFKFQKKGQLPVNNTIHYYIGKLPTMFSDKNTQNKLNVLLQKCKTIRHLGAMGSEIINLFHEGGVFAFPNSKLSLLCEVLPFSHLIESGNGIAINEKGENITDIFPISISKAHKFIEEKSSIIAGNKIIVSLYKDNNLKV